MTGVASSPPSLRRKIIIPRPPLAALSLAALGVIYGDIGTSLII